MRGMNHMQRSIPVSFAILLAACGVAATTSNDAAESATQKSRGKAKQQPRIGFESFDRGGMAGCFDPRLSGYARAAAERIGGVPCETGAAGNNAGGDPWVGEYEGPADEGMRGTVSIARGSAANRYRVEVGVAGPGCGGGVDGTGTVANNRMSLSVRVPDEPEQCQIFLDRNGSSLNVTEAGGCLYFHGAQCRFDARVSRTRSAGAAPNNARASAPSRPAAPWIVGAWATSLHDCRGMNGVTLLGDGNYIGADESGRWSLAGTTLTLVITHVPTEDPDADEQLRQPRRASVSVAPLANGRMSWRVGNRPAIAMMRCPVN